MRALALLGVFVVAKLAILSGRPVQISFWTPIAYFWQDILVALTFFLLDLAIRRAWFGWTLYGAAVSYVAINVPIARTLSSPLTWPMIGAARGALSDSIRHHATPANFALMSLTIASGIALPLLIRRLQAQKRIALIIPALSLALLLAAPIALLGPFATSRVETIGLDRNAIMALVTTALPRLSARITDVEIKEDWRVSPFGSGSNDGDLSRWRGAAAGRNVVLIVLESAGAEYLRPYGASHDPMPNLSELAGASLVFEDAYAVYPESIKALFSILCSRYPAMDTETESYARITTP
ncbi:MAG TPA: sulfatase-like hydrolase/transferase, partial [Blastocatellia bacterium]|nr:sulfatase-like hydrolase/transferase [Blastocatellia bacterium]